jgi:hypothetical protein
VHFSSSFGRKPCSKLPSRNGFGRAPASPRRRDGQRRERPCCAVPPARAARHAALPEAACPEAGMTPRQIVFRARHAPRRYFPGAGSCPCCTQGTPPAHGRPLLRHLAYLRLPSRLTRAHDRSVPRAPSSRHGHLLGELRFLLTPPAARPSNALPRSHRSSENHVLPYRPPSLAGRRAAVAGAAGYRPTPSPRPPRSQLRAQIDQR